MPTRTLLHALLMLGFAGCSGGDGEPSYLKRPGDYQFTCYLERSADNKISVKVLNDGKRLEIDSRGERKSLEFLGMSFFGDELFGDGKVELRLDPELYVSGLRGGRRGPCQEE